MTARRIAKTTFALLIIASFVYVGRDYLDQLPRILEAHPLGVFGIAAVHLVTVWLQGLTLRQGLRPLGHRIGHRESFGISVMGAYSNLLIPRAGVGIAGAYLKGSRKIPVSDYALVVSFNAAIFVLVCTLATLIAFAWHWTDLQSLSPGPVVIGLLLMIAISAAALLVPWRLPKFYRGPGRNFLQNLSRARIALSSSRIVPQLVAIHLAMLLLRGVRLQIAFWAMGISADFSAVMLISFFSDLAFVVSITPGAMGFREAAIAFLAALVGTSPAMAVSVAVFDRIVFSVTVVVIAQWILARVINDRRFAWNRKSSNRDGQATVRKRAANNQGPLKVLLVASREPSYSRVAIVRRALEMHYDVTTVCSGEKRYPIRLLILCVALFKLWITGRLRQFDLVFVGFFAQPIFPLVRLLTRRPIVADAYFSIYDTLVHDKCKARDGSLIARICFWLDRTMLCRADLCFTDTKAHVRYLSETFGVDPQRLRRLWISAEQPPLEHRPQWKSGEPFEVFFWGGFIPLQGAPTIIHAAHRLRNENIRFTLYGSGQTFAECDAQADTLGISNVRFAGWQSPAAIEAFASKAHLALGIFGDTAKAGRVIPNKAFEAMAMGIPLLTRQSDAVDELLQHNHDVILIPPNDSEALAEKILWCRDHYLAIVEMASNAALTFQRIASPDQVARTLAQEIDGMFEQVGSNRGDESVPSSPSQPDRKPGTTNLTPVP